MTPTLTDALDRLRAALDQLSDALVSGDSSRVLAAEEPLAAAVGQLSAPGQFQPADAAAMRHAVAGVRRALGRAQALGRVATDLHDATFTDAGYGRPPRVMPPAATADAGLVT